MSQNTESMAQSPPRRVTYSFTNGRRMLTIARTLAALALFLFVLGYWFQSIRPGVAAAVALVFYGIVIFLYDIYLWKLPIANKFNGLPNLQGRWQGTLHLEGQEPSDVTIDVNQIWSEMGFELSSDILACRAVMVALDIADQNAIRVAWNYSCIGTNALAEGGIEATLDQKNMTMAGNLFNRTGQQGRLSVQLQG